MFNRGGAPLSSMEVHRAWKRVLLAAQVRYRAQAFYLGPNATFADARAAEQQAASDLGLSATAVANAWQAQGVTASWQPPCSGL